MPTPQRTAVHVLWKSPHPSNPGMTTASRGAIGRDARKKAPARSPIRSRADAVSRRERNLERRSKNASIILGRTGCGRARDRKILRGHPRKTGRTRSATHERPWCWSSSVVRHGTLRFQAGRVGTALPPHAGQTSGARPRSGSVDFSPRPVSGAAQYVHPHGAMDHAARAGRLRWAFRMSQSQCPRRRRCRP